MAANSLGWEKVWKAAKEEERQQREGGNQQDGATRANRVTFDYTTNKQADPAASMKQQIVQIIILLTPELMHTPPVRVQSTGPTRAQFQYILLKHPLQSTCSQPIKHLSQLRHLHQHNRH